MSDKEIVNKQTGEIVPMNEMPEFQGVDAQDTIRIPLLQLMQGDRQEVLDGLCENGDILNSMTKENHKKEVEVVPIFQRPTTRIRGQDRDQGGGMLCISRSGTKPEGDPGDQYKSCSECPFSQDNKACSMNYEIIALVKRGDDPMGWDPVLLTADYIKASNRGIRDILAQARYVANRGIRLFHKSYILKSGLQKSKQGKSYWALSCIPGNNNSILPADQIKSLETMMRSYATAKIDTAGAHGEEQEMKEGAPANW